MTQRSKRSRINLPNRRLSSATGATLRSTFIAILASPPLMRWCSRPIPGRRPGIHDFTSAQTATVNRAQFAAIGCKLYGVDDRLLDMDRLGIDTQAISPSPGQYFYFTDLDVGRSAARLINDGIAEAVAAHPDRFVGMGTVPLQDVDQAIVEMRCCVRDLDLRGIEISSNIS